MVFPWHSFSFFFFYRIVNRKVRGEERRLLLCVCLCVRVQWETNTAPPPPGWRSSTLGRERVCVREECYVLECYDGLCCCVCVLGVGVVSVF